MRSPVCVQNRAFGEFVPAAFVTQSQTPQRLCGFQLIFCRQESLSHIVILRRIVCGEACLGRNLAVAFARMKIKLSASRPHASAVVAGDSTNSGISMRICVPSPSWLLISMRN